MTMPTGHPRESDLRWTASPMWLAMMDAAVACGVEDRMDEARITDAKVWARIGDKHWPHPDPVVRLRFQLLWTANVQARCGLDPNVSTPAADERVTRRAPNGMTYPEVRAAVVARYQASDTVTIAEIADSFRIKRSTVSLYLRDAEVEIRPADARKAAVARWADPSARARMAERMRQRHQALKERAHAA